MFIIPVMEYYTYILHYPDGEKQEIRHSLTVGDIVDLNGNLLRPSELDPKQITYRVSGIKKHNHFKENYIHYKLDLLNRDEVEDEITFNESKGYTPEKLQKVFLDLEKKMKKRKGL